MFGLGSKRPRVSRSVAIRAPETLWGRTSALVRNREVMARLGLTVGAVLLVVILLQSWRAPFPFREGDYVPHGIAAKIEFERIDAEETKRAKDRAERDVPFIFRNDPRPLEALPEKLRVALGEIAQAARLSDLREETRLAFGISMPATDAPALMLANERFGTTDYEARFAALKKSVVDMSMAQQRIDEMVDDFSKFIRPIIKNGLIDPEDVRRLRLESDFNATNPAAISQSAARYLTVVNDREPAAPVVEGDAKPEQPRLLLAQVRIEDQLNDAGELGKSWLSYPSLSPDIHDAIAHWLIVQSEPSLRADQNATKLAIADAIEAVPPRTERFLVGDQLVGPGEVINADLLKLLRDEYAAYERGIAWTSRLTRMSIIFGLCLILAVINGYYIITHEPRLSQEFTRLSIYLGTLVLTLFAARLVTFDLLRVEVIPLLLALLFLCIAYNQFLATLTAFSLCLILVFATTARLDQFVVLLSTSAAAIIPLSNVSSRLTMIKVSLLAAASYFFVSLGVNVIETQSLSDVFGNETFLYTSLLGASFCLLAGLLVAGILPLFEASFGVVTDMTLMELGDASHPLLQELVRVAPGTYNHSISVSSIAEAAAEKIGANGLLVRVGAYFHDVGKMLKPHYFIENVEAGCESRHKQLNPTMSTLIIIGHVKDGVDLAEQHHLPRPIIDFIEQHHGTTLVEYFFREATKQAEADPERFSECEESSFRYPGPKPRTKEAGVLMIADCCESACRTLTEPTPKRIESLVHTLVMRRLLDGQFDECDLKMTEIREIEQSVVKSLIGIYHGRIRYPDARTA